MAFMLLMGLRIFYRRADGSQSGDFLILVLDLDLLPLWTMIGDDVRMRL